MTHEGGLARQTRVAQSRLSALPDTLVDAHSCVRLIADRFGACHEDACKAAWNPYRCIGPRVLCGVGGWRHIERYLEGLLEIRNPTAPGSAVFDLLRHQHGKTVFRFGCGPHYEMDAVYPGDPPKQEHTEASITIANGKTQMDFAGFTYLLDGPRFEGWPPNTHDVQPAGPRPSRKLDGDKWEARWKISSSTF